MKPDKQMQERIAKIESGEWKELPWFAWPGGYAMVYYNSDMEYLCAECATRIHQDPESYCYEKPVSGRYIESGEILTEPVVCSDCDKVIEEASDPSDWDQSTWESMGFTEQEWKDLCDPDYSGLDQNTNRVQVSPTRDFIVQQSPSCTIGEEEPQQLSMQDPAYHERYLYWH